MLKFKNHRYASLTLWVILIIVTLSLVGYLVSQQGNRVGPPYVTSGGSPLPTATPQPTPTLVPTATPQPTATPGAGGGFPFTPPRAIESGGTNFYTIPGVEGLFSAGSSSTLGGAVSGIYYPINTRSSTFEIDQIGIQVAVASGTGGSVARLCIYNADDDWQPTGTLVLDAGTVATDSTGIKTITLGTAQSLPAGPYLLLMVYDSNFNPRSFFAPFPINPALQTTGTIRQIALPRYTTGAAGHATGGCPSTGTTWDTFSTGLDDNVWHVFVRVSTP